MRRSRHNRYRVGDEEIDGRIEDLLAAAARLAPDAQGQEFAREIIVTGLRLLSDRATRGDLKLLNSALKELRHAFRVFAPFAHHRKVACFGSARTPPNAPEYRLAYEFADRITDAGWMVITGAGDGIMGAAQGGAGREASFGVNIRLPFEQAANPVIANDRKLVNFRYFFSRKVVFVKEAHAIVLFPGGFGTHDEGFEALTLVQTGKGQIQPIVFLDVKGGDFWQDLDDYMHTRLVKRGMISPEDVHLYRVTDSVDVALREVLNFYSNYHSSRFVGDELVLRVNQAPTEAQLEVLNRDFADLLLKGSITVRAALPEEREALEHPRVVLAYHKRSTGRLRQLIDALNALVPQEASSPVDAEPPEVPEERLPEQAELEEDRDG